MVTRSQREQSKALQRRTGRTFHVATRFLPERLREDTYVLYAFFRIADEVVDDPNPDPPGQQRAELERIRQAALGDRKTDDVVLDAFSSVRDRVGIPDHEVNTFIDAMLADVDTSRYETFEELEDYLRGSAVAVAYMMLEIMEPPEKERARPHARALGEAFQLTNFLRDVREDIREHDRIYIPRESLRRHGLDFEAIEQLEFSPAFRRVMADELARTERRYRMGVAGLELLPRECRFPVLLASVLYGEHHAKIRALDGNVLDHRPTLGYLDYVRLLGHTWWSHDPVGNPENTFYRVGAVGRQPTARRATDDDYRDLGTLATVTNRLSPRLFDRRE